MLRTSVGVAIVEFQTELFIERGRSFFTKRRCGGWNLSDFHLYRSRKYVRVLIWGTSYLLLQYHNLSDVCNKITVWFYISVVCYAFDSFSVYRTWHSYCRKQAIDGGKVLHMKFRNIYHHRRSTMLTFKMKEWYIWYHLINMWRISFYA